MADNSYKVSAEISTSNSVTNLRTLNKAIDETATALKALNQVTKEGEKSLDSMVSGVSALLAAYRQAAQAEKEMAQAKLATAKVTAQQTAQNDKAAESASRVALNNARQKQAEEQATLATTRAANEYIRTEGALTNQRTQSQVAQDRLSLSQQRYADQQRRTAQNELELRDNLSNTRYMLYDVGATYRTISLGLEAIPVATAAVAAAYQRDFAQVLRISAQTNEQAQSLRDGLVNLSTALPIGFDQLTQIAQLGAHLQLGNEGLVAFTETVAKFTAATGVSADTSSQMFSRMKTAMNDSSEAGNAYFDKLGSSIAQMGTVVVATDQEVASMVTQINAVTSSAGIGTAATVGLAGAMASLRIQPEMARGALTRLFAAFNRDSAEGAQGMQKFADVMHMSAQEATNLWKSNPTQFFTQLVGGLHTAYQNGQNLTTLFDNMNVKNVRDVNTLTRLAVGYDVLGRSMKAANEGYDNGSELDKLAGPTFNTLIAKLTELGNAFKGLADEIGSASLGPLTAIVSGITDMVKGFSDLAKGQPVIMGIIQAFMGLSMVAGVFMAIKTAQVFVLAGLVSFRQMMGSAAMGAASFSGIMKQLAVNQIMAKGATEAQAQALVKEASAFTALTIAARLNKEQLGRIGPNEAVSFSTLSSRVTEAGGSMGRFGTSIKGVLSSALGLVGGIGGLTTMIGGYLVSAMLAAQQQGDQLAETLGKSLSGSSENATKAAGDLVKAFKVSNMPTGGLGFNFDDYDRSLADIASRAGVSMDKLVSSLAKGKAGAADFKKYLDEVAKSKGYDGIGDIRIQQSAPWDKGASDLYFIQQAYDRVSQKAQATNDSTKQVDDSVAKLGGAADKAAGDVSDLGDGMDLTATAADKLDKALKAINDTVFGMIDKEAALGDAMSKLGEGLQKGGVFNNSEAGRANLKNLEDTLRAAQEYYALQVKTHALTGQQGEAGYADFVEQLLGKVKAQGGDAGAIAGLAHQTVSEFNKVVGQDSSANPATVQVATKVDTVQPVQQAKEVGAQVATVLAAEAPTLNITANADDASQKVYTLALSLSKITGMPLEVVIDALTNPASDKAAEVQKYINDIVKDPKKFSINADTTAAVQNVQNFAAYAARQLAAVQSYVNSVAATAPVLSQFIVPGVKPNLTGTPYKPGLGGGTLSSMQMVNAPAQVQAANAAADANAKNAAMLNNVNAGYDKAALAADKAGQKGKKAGEDTANAWKDAGDGIDQATAAADDYASRLKTGLDRQFEKQHGVQDATDAYYQKLNEIKKAREDEIKQVSDLRDKIKQANDEMNKDQIDANKAQIEARISQKYGEVDRMADYQNQAKTALDNAAAKKKEIDADQQQADTIQAGIGLLTGYSEAAIKNRQDLEGLQKAELDMVVAYAKTGASIDQVRAYAQSLNGQFQKDVTQIGFNQTAVQNLTGDLNQYIGVIDRVPYVKPTQVTADTKQAEDAISQLGNDFNSLGDQIDNNPLTIQLKYDITEPNGYVQVRSDAAAKADFYGVSGTTLGGKANGGIAEGYATGVGIVPGTPPSDLSKDNLLALVDGKRPIGIQSGEGIVRTKAVDYYGGAPFIDALNKMKLPRYALGGVVGSAGSAGGNPSLVELTAEQLRFIADALKVSLQVDSREIARASNRGNREIASEGGRRG